MSGDTQRSVEMKGRSCNVKYATCSKLGKNSICMGVILFCGWVSVIASAGMREAEELMEHIVGFEGTRSSAEHQPRIRILDVR
jgi:hypothetical protein